MSTRKDTLIQRRSITSELRPAGNRTRHAIIATANPVRVFDRSTGRIIDEALVMSGAELPAKCPLLLDHDRSVRSMAGSVSNFRVSGSTLEADLSFASGVSSGDEAWELASQGHLTGVSVGYRANEYHELRDGQTELVDGMTYRGPCRIVTRWTLYEVSAVPVGADPAAMMRSRSFSSSVCERDGDMPTTLDRELSDLRPLDYMAAYVSGRSREVIDNPHDLIQRWAALDGFSDLADRVNSWVLDGFNNEADSTAGWVTATSLPNFLESRLAVVSQPAVALRIARGGQAAPATLSTTYESWRLMRCGLSFQLDEQDILDGQDTIDAYSIGFRETGAALRRTVIDAVYGLLLGNPLLSDGDAAFSVARGNLGTSVLGATGLSYAWGAIGGFARQVSANVACFSHVNLQPGFVITTPDKYVAAVSCVTDIADASPIVRARSESRLGSKGFLDPTSSTIRSGGDGYWLLTVPASQAPTVLVGFLNGRSTPRVRSYALSAGEWGYGFDVSLDFGVTLVSSAGLFLSTGEG